MRPESAFTAIVVVAFLLAIAPLTWWLHTGSVDAGTTTAFILIALFLLAIGLWMLRRSDAVRLVKPYRRLGFGMFLFVSGVLTILVTITLMLMNIELPDPLIVGLQNDPLRLPGLYKLLPVAGVALMFLGLWVNQSDKYYVKLED